MMIEMRQRARQEVVETKAHWVNVISFKRMDWTEMIAKVVDMSPLGVGIEMKIKVDPGFVWFPEKVDGSRCGLLMWSKQRNNTYRGGIKFVPLSPDDEQNVQKKLEESGLRDPLIVAETIMEALKKSGEGPLVQSS
jgi:hypothetical protein